MRSTSLFLAYDVISSNYFSKVLTERRNVVFSYSNYVSYDKVDYLPSLDSHWNPYEHPPKYLFYHIAERKTVASYYPPPSTYPYYDEALIDRSLSWIDDLVTSDLFGAL